MAMAAALTIAVLLALSVVIVRVAAVAMRLTGLAENVARFQCVSALTGTGFTSRESEMVVNYPVRRRILVGLIILGNIGLVSVAATFIVAFTGVDRNSDAILTQILAMAAAAGITFLVATNRTLDRLMCHVIGLVLMKTTSLGRRNYRRIFQVTDGFSLVEHVFTGTAPRPLAALSLGKYSLTILAVRSGATARTLNIGDEFVVSPGDCLLCYGPDSAHDSFEEDENATSVPPNR